jgi:hypothetical protein
MYYYFELHLVVRIKMSNDVCPGVLPVHDGGADDRGGQRAGSLPVQDPVQEEYHQERR